MDETEPNYGRSQNVRRDIARYAGPTAALMPKLADLPLELSSGSQNVESVAALLAGSLVPLESLAWSRSYNLHWMRAVKKASSNGKPMTAIGFQDPCEKGVAWLCTHTYSFFGYLAKHVVQEGAEGERPRLSLAEPLECMSSIALFGRWHARITGETAIGVDFIELDAEHDQVEQQNSSPLFTLTWRPLPTATGGASRARPRLVAAGGRSPTPSSWRCSRRSARRPRG